MSGASLVKAEVRSFVEEWWDWIGEHLPAPPVPDEKSLAGFGRVAWFCNQSLRPIAGLTTKEMPRPKFHTVEEATAKFEEEKKVKRCAFDELLEEKHYSAFRIHKCGHCFFDLAIVLGVLDYLNFPYSDSQEVRRGGKESIQRFVKAKLTALVSGCGICGQQADSRPVNMYAEMTSLDCGTIIRSSHQILHKRLLGAISSTLKVGQVIDTEGYRGLSLYIYEGLSEDGNPIFLKVPTGEYYPIWPLYYLLQNGYKYYLSASENFDALLLPNGYAMVSNSGYGKMGVKMDFVRQDSMPELSAAAKYVPSAQNAPKQLKPKQLKPKDGLWPPEHRTQDITIGVGHPPEVLHIHPDSTFSIE